MSDPDSSSEWDIVVTSDIFGKWERVVRSLITIKVRLGGLFGQLGQYLQYIKHRGQIEDAGTEGRPVRTAGGRTAKKAAASASAKGTSSIQGTTSGSI